MEPDLSRVVANLDLSDAAKKLLLSAAKGDGHWQGMLSLNRASDGLTDVVAGGVKLERITNRQLAEYKAYFAILTREEIIKTTRLEKDHWSYELTHNGYQIADFLSTAAA